MIPLPAAARKKRILVVEDEPDSGDLMALVLGAEYEVEVARDGVEGVERCAAWEPDLVITDVNMPRLSGLEMVRHLRRRQGLKAPVIFVTSLNAPSDIIAGISAGARHYLTKPVQFDDLMQSNPSANGVGRTSARPLRFDRCQSRRRRRGRCAQSVGLRAKDARCYGSGRDRG